MASSAFEHQIVIDEQTPSAVEFTAAILLAFFLVPASLFAALVRRAFYANPGVPLWRDALMSVLRRFVMRLLRQAGIP